MKKKMTQLIPAAIKAIKAVKIMKDGRIPSVYHGYTSSLGAGIIQAGLLPAVIFFENSEGDGKKYKLTQAIRILLANDAPENIHKDYKLSEYLMNLSNPDDPQIRKKVGEIAVALKIAMRTFKKVES